MMKAPVFAFMFTFFAMIALAQKSQPSSILIYPDSEGIEIVPEFPGGNAEFSKYIQKNLKWPVRGTSEGKVIVNFVVEKDGKVTDVKIAKSLSPLYDAEALRVIKSSPRWHPGKSLRGKKVKLVRMKLSIPILFSRK
jgi:protein TonB